MLFDVLYYRHSLVEKMIIIFVSTLMYSVNAYIIMSCIYVYLIYAWMYVCIYVDMWVPGGWVGCCIM